VTAETARAHLEVHDLGTVPYAEALAVQADLVGRRRAGEIGDRLLLLEHPHVITLGTGADEEHILATEADRRLLGIELHETGRGGDVTYHGPGQLVGYPILALPGARRDLHRYVRDLESVLIAALATYGIDARREDGLTGVWTDAGKIAAIGVRVSSGWITSHGFALNVAPRLDYFGAIVPCGIRGRTVTSMEAILGEAPDMGEVQGRVAEAFAAEFAAGGRTEAS
jgi:lipoyl(octanoyl) transferase